MLLVRSHVAMHVAVGGEGQVAVATVEGSLPRVDEHVSVQR